MIHAVHRPNAPLDQFVDFIWFADDYVAETPRERVLPSGAPVLVVHLGGSPIRLYEGGSASTFEAVLSGARQRPLILGTQLGPTVGIHFKPGGARPFFDVPADELAERAVSLEALWGASARSLRERLIEATTPLQRLHLLEAHLLERARRPLVLDPALRIALDAFEESDLSSVTEVNRRTALSPKRLLALFRDTVGLSPKAFWRVRRFQAAVRDLEQESLRGAALAYEHGYFDQAHFLREFRAHANTSPREYLAWCIAGTGHMSIRG